MLKNNIIEIPPENANNTTVPDNTQENLNQGGNDFSDGNDVDSDTSVILIMILFVTAPRANDLLSLLEIKIIFMIFH